MIVIAIILVILGFALPNAQKMMMASREMAAIREIQTIQTAQAQYYAQFGAYAKVLAQLGPPANGPDGRDGPGLIPEDLAAGRHQGHQFTVTGDAAGYVIQVVPEKFGGTGSRTFYSDESLVIRNNFGPEPATKESPPIQ